MLQVEVNLCFCQAEDGIRDYKVTGVHVCSSDLDCSDSLRFSHLAFLRLVVSLGDRQLPGEAMIAGGSWTVLDGHGREIGRVEGDEFVRCGTRLIYRIEIGRAHV